MRKCYDVDQWGGRYFELGIFSLQIGQKLSWHWEWYRLPVPVIYKGIKNAVDLTGN
jgi:hypothetical protein